MGIDWSITWKDTPPAEEEILLVLEDYLAFEGSLPERHDTGFYTILLPGKPSFPFKRVDPESVFSKANLAGTAYHPEGRWFEIWINDGLTITIRQQDELTSNIARGFAKLCARYWHGELTEPG